MSNVIKNILLMIFISTLVVISLVPNSISVASVFGIGYVFIQVVIIVGVVLLLSGIPTLIFFLVRKKMWRGFFVTMWIIWVLLALFFIMGQVALHH